MKLYFMQFKYSGFLTFFQTNQAGLSASINGDFSAPSGGGVGSDDATTNSTNEELQDRIIQLEQELIDAQEKHDEELEMEKVGGSFVFVFLVSLFYKNH